MQRKGTYIDSEGKKHYVSITRYCSRCKAIAMWDSNIEKYRCPVCGELYVVRVIEDEYIPPMSHSFSSEEK